jgi:hypothetical protein
MLQLVYVSTACQPLEEDLLEAILAASRGNNARVGITGLLVAGGRRFLQALEGPDKAVLDTYARIQSDPRHRALVLLSTRIVAERAFGDWAMAYQAGGDASAAPDLRQAVAALAEGIEDRNLRAQFVGFADLHARGFTRDAA